MYTFLQSYFYHVAITRLQVSFVGGAYHVGVWLTPGCMQYRIVIGGIQMAEILMQKLPDIFHVYFRREGDISCPVQLMYHHWMVSLGVMHSMNKLTSIPLKVSNCIICMLY